MYLQVCVFYTFHVVYYLLSSPIADPAVFISPDVQYVLEGESLSIEAGVFASSTPMVQWFHRGQLIDINSDPQVSQQMTTNLYTLTVANVDNLRLGEYSIVATLNGQMSTDSVNVTYPSKCFFFGTNWYKCSCTCMYL